MSQRHDGTLMQVIVGLLARDGGAVALDGRLGYYPQEPLLWDKLTAPAHFRAVQPALQARPGAG